MLHKFLQAPMDFTSLVAKCSDTRNSIMGQGKFYPDRKFPFFDLYRDNPVILKSTGIRCMRKVVIWERCAPI